MRTTLAVGLALLASCQAHRPPEAWVGCYQLVAGAWDQVPESLLAAQPQKILRLLPERASVGSFHNGPRVDTGSTIVRAARLDASEARWWVVDAAQLRVTTLGLTGRTLTLRGTSDSLRGQLQTFTDMIQPDSTGALRSPMSQAPVTATRIDCDT